MLLWLRLLRKWERLGLGLLRKALLLLRKLKALLLLLRKLKALLLLCQLRPRLPWGGALLLLLLPPGIKPGKCSMLLQDSLGLLDWLNLRDGWPKLIPKVIGGTF